MREVALQALYQIEVGAKSLEEVLLLGWVHSLTEEALRERVRKLVKEAYGAKEKDLLAISQYASKDMSQISVIVISILRLGLGELREGRLGAQVIIDDLLNLVRRYDGEDSVAFVNAILDAFWRSNPQISVT